MRTALCLIVLCLGATAVRADAPSPALEHAVNNFSHELLACVAYNQIGAEAAMRLGRTDVAAASEALAKRAFDLASHFNEPETMAARLNLEVKQQAALMKGDFANWSVLIERYGEPCKAALENPRQRLLHWLSSASLPASRRG